MEYTKDYFDQVTDRTGTHCAKYDSMSMFFPGDDLVPMWIADMEFRCPQELNDAIRKRTECGIYGYPELSGTAYHHFVVDWQRKRNGIEYAEDDVFFGESALTGVKLAIHALAKGGEEVLMFLPTYSYFHKYVVNMGRVPVMPHLVHDENGYSIDFEALDATLAEHDIKLLIFCSPFNPVGRVWTEEELTKLITICQKHGVPIVSDEVHSDFIMPGHTFIPTAAVARKLGYDQNVITTSSISKTFNCAGINAGYYIVHGEEMQAKIAASAKFFDASEMLGGFGYLALEQVYTESGSKYVDALCEYVYDNYRYLCDHLAALPFADDIVVSDMQGTYLAWIQFKNYGDAERLTYEFCKHGVALEDDEEFFEEEGHFIRFNLAAPRAIIERAVERTEVCLKALYSAA